MNQYTEFITSKAGRPADKGKEVESINPLLFPFQQDLTRWALRKGRAAIFADCGLGKTFMQIEWAQHLLGKVLILAPLSVAQQTVREAAKLGYEIAYARSQDEITTRITVTNYEMIEHFDASEFAGVVLDESSILKSIDGKTKARLIEMFADTPYRLCCTATPAPNDVAEFANHAEFLGIATRVEMLARFFVHDDQGWRLKGHAREPFYQWLASWGMSLAVPSDLGYSDEGYILPKLSIVSNIVHTDYVPEGQMFATDLKGVGHRAQVRRATIEARVDTAVSLMNAETDSQWIAWCGLNDESHRIAAALGDEAIEVEGSMAPEEKSRRLLAFMAGDYRVLVTKPRIAGFGMNFQNASRQVFVGMSDSYEAYYQCIRRSYRFGQESTVDAHIVLSDLEQPIYDNVLRKEDEAKRSQRALVANSAQYERAEIENLSAKEDYVTTETKEIDFHIMLGDAVERIAEIEDDSIDLSIYSPPFASLYTYSASDRDMGNSATHEQFFEHYGYLVDEILRVTKPGRTVAVHCQQLSTTLSTHGVIGWRDFRGELIAEHVRRGFVYQGEVCIDKDPQAQAIRTHSKGLLFVQLRKDSSWLRPAMADYILLFRKPGDNQVAIHPDITNNEWIEWARPIWYGIKETETLNVRPARSHEDERHICPLQLGTIERVVRLWSNPGETVLSPFMGIGSEGVVSLRHGRKFVGIELKQQYYDVAQRNIEGARLQGVMDLEAVTA